LKAIGNQWFWSYEYPDHGGIQLTANMLKEQGEVPAGTRYRTDADGPRLLATDTRVVLPVGVPIRLLTTAQDVIHAWAIPAFWIKLDAVPGRINETSFIIEKPGVYYGQCSELCGARHGYMPITVEAVSPEVFARWVASKGGKMPAAGAATTTAAGPAATETDDTTNGTEGANIAVTNATAAPAVTNAPATANPAGAGNTGN
jgi:cytochrome c oxidase subunit 2